MELRPEQRTTVDKAKKVLAEFRLCYLAAEVRTGKTIMALSIANEGVRKKYDRVLFVTKLKAISSIQSDFKKTGYTYSLKVINYEKLKNEGPWYDLIICDEAHCMGAFPKPSLRTKEIKRIMGRADLILMSGTPSPESKSQMYHQFWVHELSPFAQFKNFYRWGDVYVDKQKKFIRNMEFNDYSKSRDELIDKALEKYIVTFSQQQAGFKSFVQEEVHSVAINPKLYALMKILKKDKVYNMKQSKDVILADTPVKMQMLFHQISSGTVKVGENRYTLDTSKADYIRKTFFGKKIAIYYLFIQEGELLKSIFTNWTDSPEVFNTSKDKTFICQMVSGREGVNLSTADYLVMYNIAFSATTYWQVRARMQTKDRTAASKIAWIFSERGLEGKVYKAVQRKKDFTLAFFKEYLFADL